MRKTLSILSAALLIAMILFTGCLSTGGSASGSEDNPADRKLIVGDWQENPNRDGNVETHSWGKDGSFLATVYTQDGTLVEIDSGTWCFENGQIKITIDLLGGDWNDGKLEPFGTTVECWYDYEVSKDAFHTERTKRSMGGEVEYFNPPLKDDYKRPPKACQDPVVAQKLIVGEWIENPNRDGLIETVIWGEDGSFSALLDKQDGTPFEVNYGTYEFKDGELVVTVTEAGGEYNGMVREPIGGDAFIYYDYLVTEDSLRLERIKRVLFGKEEVSNPPVSDFYKRK